MRRVFVGIVVLVLVCCGCTPASHTGHYAAGPSVRFVRDTLFEKAQLPIRGEAWSPSGRWFIAENSDGIRIVDAAASAGSIFFPLSVAHWSFAWSPGDSVLACHLRFGALSESADSLFLFRPGRAREPLAVQPNVGSLLWLPTGALVAAGTRGEYAVLRPGSSHAAVDTCDRIWAAHHDWTSGTGRFVGLVPTICAPASSSPVPELAGWSRVVFEGDAYPWMWWASRTRHFVTRYSEVGMRHFDAMGRVLDTRPPRESDAVVYTLAARGDVAVGGVNPDPSSQAGPTPYPAYAWSGDGSWRSPIAGLEGGIFGASAAPVGDRILFETKRGLELGRLVIER